MSKFKIFLVLLMITSVHSYAQVSQALIDKQVNYLNSQIKYFWDQGVYSAQVTTITSSQYESQKPSGAFLFDCGYLDDDGKVFVSEPVTDAQKKIFSNITEAALYYVNQSFFRFYYRVNEMPIWFITGFAAFEADLKISDTMIKDAINSYGGSLPSFTSLNNKTDFDSKNGIAVAYLWGELMNVTFGWWRYFDVESVSAQEVKMNASAKSMSTLFSYFRRYTNLRILESIERFRLKYQGESDHFKFYYRDNENYCMPYMQNALEEAYTQYSSELAIQSPKKATYSFQPECEGAKLDSIECTHRYTGGTAWASGLVTSCADKVEDLPMFRGLVRHELAHLFQFLIKPAYQPAWLSEGFASFLPDGLMTEQTMRNESGFAIHKFEYAKAKIGHYPTLSEMEDYDFNSRNGLDYYLFGLLMNDFVARKGGYPAIKNILTSRGQDFTSLGYSTKQQFEEGFYDYYNTYWAPKPKTVTIKKTNGKPIIDGIISESVWDKSILLERAFSQEGAITNVPVINNSAAASMVWDDENLYVAIDIKDANESGGYLDFLSDGIELDIDPDLSRGVDFKDNDMAFVWNTIYPTASYRTKLTGANFSYVKNSSGYSVEISIPWNVLGITPGAGKKFGLELLNYDRDNDVYKGTLVFSGHTWQGGVALNGLAEVTLSNEPAAKGLQLIAPAGGDVFIAGDTEAIKFGGFNISNVKIEFSSDGGTSWNTLAAGVPAASGVFNWTVPSSLTDRGLIRVSDIDNNSILDITKTSFKIVRANTRFGPYIADANTALLMHFNGNIRNSALSGDGSSSGIKYQPGVNSNMGNAAELTAPITIPHSAVFNLPGSYTIEMWVKFNSFNNNGTTLITKPGDNDSYFANYTLEINPWWGNVFHGFYFDQANNRVGVSGFTPELNKWYHVAYVRDAAAKEIRIEVCNESGTQINLTKRYYTETLPLLLNSKEIIIGKDLDGYIDEIRISNICRDFTVGIEDDNKGNKIPEAFSLEQNYPNPFNPSTTIKYAVPNAETPYTGSLHVTLKIYDLTGREIATLVNESKPAGAYTVKFDASNLPSGVYMYRLITGSKMESKKMILLK